MRKAILLFLIIIASGCTGQEAVRDLTGVQIQEFNPDLQEVAAGNDVTLMLKVQNVGDSGATNVKAQMYLCGNLKIDGDACPTPPAKYSLGDLSGADISSGLPGESAVRIFKASTSDLKNAKNERIEQELGVKVSYDYSSTATAEIPVLSTQRYKELERTGKLPQTKKDASFAPIVVDITAPDTVIGTTPATIEIGLQKMVEGYVEDTACPAGKQVGCIRSVKIELSGSGLDKQDCSDRTNEQLWRTGETKFPCTLKPNCAGDECYAVVKVTASYIYVAEQTTRITVKGT